MTLVPVFPPLPQPPPAWPPLAAALSIPIFARRGVGNAEDQAQCRSGQLPGNRCETHSGLKEDPKITCGSFSVHRGKRDSCRQCTEDEI